MIAIEWTCRSERPTRWDALALAGGGAWLAAFLLPLLPAVQRAWPACHFLLFTGIPCGTCGFTRAFVRTARLDLGGALAASPLATLLFCGWIAFAASRLATWLVPGLRLPLPRLHPLAARWGPLVLFVANWAWLICVGGPA